MGAQFSFSNTKNLDVFIHALQFATFPELNLVSCLRTTFSREICPAAKRKRPFLKPATLTSLKKMLVFAKKDHYGFRKVRHLDFMLLDCLNNEYADYETIQFLLVDFVSIIISASFSILERCNKLQT